MGVNCRILLPPAARIYDVADVLGGLAGLQVKKRKTNPWATYVLGVDCRSYPGKGLEAYALISLRPEIRKDLVGGSRCHECMYHFEGGPKGERLLMPRSTAFWIAVGKGLVDFFGGTLDFQDFDDKYSDYKKPMVADIHAEDGNEWDRLQNRKLNVKPITWQQLKAADQHASYKMEVGDDKGQ